MNEYRPGRTLAIAVTALLAGGVVADLLAVLGQGIVAFVLGQSLESYADVGHPAFIASALLLTVGGLGQFGLFVLTVIVFLIWFHRAATNAAGFATEPLEHGPGWAAFGFFVPFLNLVRPYQVARQIEAASGGMTSQWISGWWGAFIVNNIVGNIEFRMTSGAGDDALFIVMAIGMVTGAIASFFCAKMMFYVEELQLERSKSPHDLAAVFS